MSVLNENGLTIETLPDVITGLTTLWQTIYGNDVILTSASPDGQLLNNIAIQFQDLTDLLLAVYTSFDPDQAIGTTLDQRVSINNIQRRGATFTLQNVNITTNRALNLQGLDAQANDINGTGYTIADNNGNEFILLDSTNIAGAGTYNLTFRAKDLGALTTLPNTITEPVTIVVGVTAINNPTAQLEIGADEETDAELRLRRQKSTANGSSNYLNGLGGVLSNITGVTEVKIYENDTSITDTNGIPDHSIWVIVEGGANTEIADAIYKRKTAGCGMKGLVEVDIITEFNSIFTAKFDRPLAKNLYIRFDLKQTIIGQAFNQVAIKNYITNNLTYTIGASAETGTITCIALAGINNSGGGGVPLNVEISKDGLVWFDFLNVDVLNEKWVVSSTNITITEI